MVPKQQEFPSNPMNQDLYSQIASGDVGHVEAYCSPWYFCW